MWGRCSPTTTTVGGSSSETCDDDDGLRSPPIAGAAALTATEIGPPYSASISGSAAVAPANC